MTNKAKIPYRVLLAIAVIVLFVITVLVGWQEQQPSFQGQISLTPRGNSYLMPSTVTHSLEPKAGNSQIYQNEELGFYFKYPLEVEIVDINSGLEDDHLLKIRYCDVLACNYAEQLDIEQSPVMNVEELRYDYYSDFYSTSTAITPHVISKEIISIANQSGLLVKVVNPWHRGAGDLWVHVIHNGMLFTFSSVIYGPVGDSPNGPVNAVNRHITESLPLFLSTLRFTK